MLGAGEQIRTADVLLGKRLIENQSWQANKHSEIISITDEILRIAITVIDSIVISPR